MPPSLEKKSSQYRNNGDIMVIREVGLSDRMSELVHLYPVQLSLSSAAHLFPSLLMRAREENDRISA